MKFEHSEEESIQAFDVVIDFWRDYWKDWLKRWYSFWFPWGEWNQ